MQKMLSSQNLELGSRGNLLIEIFRILSLDLRNSLTVALAFEQDVKVKRREWPIALGGFIL